MTGSRINPWGRKRWHGLLRRFASRNDDLRAAYFSPTLNGSSLPGGTVSSAIASSIATIT